MEFISVRTQPGKQNYYESWDKRVIKGIQPYTLVRVAEELKKERNNWKLTESPAIPSDRLAKHIQTASGIMKESWLRSLQETLTFGDLKARVW